VFGLAKGISVLVLGICFAAIIVCLILLACVHAEPRHIDVPEVADFAAPTLTDYQEFLKSQQGSGPSGNQSGAPGATTSQQTTAELRGQQQSPGQELATLLASLDASLDLGEARFQGVLDDPAGQQAMLDGLKKFIADREQAGLDIDKPSVVWFLTTFATAWDHATEVKEARDQALERVQAEQAEADSAAAVERWQLVVAIGSALAGLMSFLFLPLLIQIEQNTRQLLQDKSNSDATL
jgi:hypothetical protein